MLSFLCSVLLISVCPYPFFFLPMYCLSLFYKRRSFYQCIVCPSIYDVLFTDALYVLLLYTTFFLPMYCLSLFYIRRSVDQCIVCPYSIYDVLLTNALYVLILYTTFFWPMHCMSFYIRRYFDQMHCMFFYIRRSFDQSIACPSIYDVLLTKCILCPSSINGCWLPLWYRHICLQKNEQYPHLKRNVN
jgi:hypothetical protein